MRKETLLGLKSPSGLFPGMLKRTKYSRLRNDSHPSSEDSPARVLPVKRNLWLASDFSPQPTVPSTLRDFMANIRIQSPLRDRPGPRTPETVPGHAERTEQRFCCQPSLCNRQGSFALRCMKRPITLQRVASLPWTPGSAPCDHPRRDKCCWDSDCSEKAGVKTAIHHDLKYMGSVEVTQSMRTLDFHTRMQVTREAISRLCERSSAKTAARSKKKSLFGIGPDVVSLGQTVCFVAQTGHKGLGLVLGQSDLRFGGSRVILSVSTESLTLICVSSLQKIAHHSMQSISFASGADPDMANYIAYVAKDQDNHRACHILECPQGGAAEVINSIGRAFETRFHQMMSQSSPLLPGGPRSHESPEPDPQATDQRLRPGLDYYNMVPGKSPPTVGKEGPHSSEQNKQQDVTMQRVCPFPPGTLYENCSSTETTVAPSGEGSGEVKDLIQEENWFHGRLDRERAESLLSSSGDFLVRESSSAAGQYVLSGREGATVRHLLLVDPNGQVRTRDKVFLSISHLIQFHMESQMPILSGTSELCLKQPIFQRH